MASPKHYRFTLSATGRPDDVALDEFWYPGLRASWESASSRRSVDPILGIKAVVIHATAGSSSEGAISVIRAGAASFHWLVPDENEPQHGDFVWACIPEARAAWHVRNDCSHASVNGGAKRVNHWSLGIEVVNSQAQDPFSDWQIKATANIVRYCWAKYPNLKHVVSHAVLDPTRRTDPGSHFDWQRFKELVVQDSPTPLPKSITKIKRATSIRAAARRNGAEPLCFP